MTTISALPDTVSISEAWRNAAVHLKRSKGHKLYNLIYAITSPSVMTDEDRTVFEAYDQFARLADIGSTTTVANTIFPLDIYRKFGSDEFYERYRSEIFPRVKTQWGTYFDRMTTRRSQNSNPILLKDGEILNPLDILVRKVKHKVDTGNGTKGHYELAVADEAFELTTYLPERDSNYGRGGPCLSHVSFKIDDEHRLRMTAVYRSHWYVERALGNLLGLAWLQAFVATQAGIEAGPLTCLALSAYLESQAGAASSDQTAKFLASQGID